MMKRAAVGALIAVVTLTGCASVSSALFDEEGAKELTATMLTNQWDWAKIYATADGRTEVTAEDLAQVQGEVEATGTTFVFTVVPGAVLRVDSTLGQYRCTASVSNEAPVAAPVCQSAS